MKYETTTVRETTITGLDLAKLGPKEEWVYDYIDELLIEADALYSDAGPSKQKWHFLSFRLEEHNMGWYAADSKTVQEYPEDTVLIVDVEVATKSWTTKEIPKKWYTIDGVEITDDLPVWDYDLNRVRIALRHTHIEVNQNTGAEMLWFDTVQPTRYLGKEMSADRVWRRHPTTGEEA